MMLDNPIDTYYDLAPRCTRPVLKSRSGSLRER